MIFPENFALLGHSQAPLKQTYGTFFELPDVRSIFLKRHSHTGTKWLRSKPGVLEKCRGDSL